jgi:hypothetical protein
MSLNNKIKKKLEKQRKGLNGLIIVEDEESISDYQ